jgi:cell division protein FtsZ
MTLFEVAEASNLVHEAAHDEANIIFGTVIDEKMGDAIKVTVIATGFRDSSRAAREEHARNAATAPRPRAAAPGRMEPVEPAAQGQTPFLRKGQTRPVAFGTEEGSYGPNFTNLKDDLDVPTFLRRQMD